MVWVTLGFFVDLFYPYLSSLPTGVKLECVSLNACESSQVMHFK